MPNHFSAIGFAVDDRNRFEEIASLAARAGRLVGTPSGNYRLYAPGAGVELWVQANHHQQIIGCHPHFSNGATLKATVASSLTSGRNPLDGSLRLEVPGGSREAPGGSYALLVDVPDFDREAARVPAGTPVVLQVAAFARELRCFADETALRRSGGPLARLASKAVIPSGLFTPDGQLVEPPRAEAILTGVVTQTELRANPLTGLEFRHAMVESLGGSFDVVADPAVVAGEPRVGGVVFGAFWLSARIVRGVS